MSIRLHDRLASEPGGTALVGAYGRGLSADWRRKQLEYTLAALLGGRACGFLASDARRARFGRWTQQGCKTRACARRLLDLYRRLAPFADVPDVLRNLARARHASGHIVELKPRYAGRCRRLCRFGGLFDAVLSVDEVGIFKTRACRL